MDLKSEIKGGRKGGRAEATMREIQITKVRGIQLSAKKEEEETTKEKTEKKGETVVASGGRLPDGRASWREGTGRCTTRTTGNELCYLRPSLLACSDGSRCRAAPRCRARQPRRAQEAEVGGGGQRQKQVVPHRNTGTRTRTHTHTFTTLQKTKCNTQTLRASQDSQ